MRSLAVRQRVVRAAAVGASVVLLAAACGKPAGNQGTGEDGGTEVGGLIASLTAGTLLISDGTDQVRIGDGTVKFPTKVTDAAWSPDGSRILFERSWGRRPRKHVYVMNADGGAQHQVGALEGSMPTWSPDGTRIALISGEAILRANADGSGVRRVAGAGTGFRLAFRSGIGWRVRNAR